MLRVFLALLSTLSLLLCGVTCVLWARAGERTQPIWRQPAIPPRTAERSLRIARGRLAYQSCWHVAGSPTPPAGRNFLPHWAGRLGLSAYEDNDSIVGILPDFVTGGRRYFFTARRNLSVRLWLLTSLLAVLPLVFVATAVTRRRPHGRCTVCGYDLRATPDRCPECGAVPLTQRTKGGIR
jgi:hypothetical protein